jgi:hypothetical protein
VFAHPFLPGEFEDVLYEATRKKLVVNFANYILAWVICSKTRRMGFVAPILTPRVIRGTGVR